MIQEITPRKLNISYDTEAYGQEDFLLTVKGGAIYLVREGEAAARAPRIREVLEQLEFQARVGKRGLESNRKKWDFIYLFEIDGKRFFMLLVDSYKQLEKWSAKLSDVGKYYWLEEAKMRELAPDWLRLGCVTAMHLSRWYREHRFCGKCGRVFRLKEDERALQCHVCGHIEYPKISPAIIVGIVDGDRLLVTRYADRRGNRYALVAGYCEVGETLEESLRREVMEEVGLNVGEIAYYKSQPWGFSDSLLMGFFAKLEGDEKIEIDGVELSEALWLRRYEIPIDDPGLALTSEMIRVFAEGYEPF